MSREPKKPNIANERKEDGKTKIREVTMGRKSGEDLRRRLFMVKINDQREKIVKYQDN
jgi:hypothetical protein